jgi:hypothetical protein
MTAAEALPYEEALDMAYENIQGEAKFGCKGVKAITLPVPPIISNN